MSGCSCDYDDADMPEVFMERWRTARKPNKCCECADVIKPGERYRHSTGKWDGRWKSFNTCEFCDGERDAHQRRTGSVVGFGELACAIYCELGVEP